MRFHPLTSNQNLQNRSLQQNLRKKYFQEADTTRYSRSWKSILSSKQETQCSLNWSLRRRTVGSAIFYFLNYRFHVIVRNKSPEHCERIT